MIKYNELCNLDEIDDIDDREIMRIFREIVLTYGKKKMQKYCLYAMELREWCKTNGRMPREIQGVTLNKKRNQETPEQEELRMYGFFKTLYKEVLKKYVGKEKISDQVMEIISILKMIDDNYNTTKSVEQKTTQKKQLKRKITIIQAQKINAYLRKLSQEDYFAELSRIASEFGVTTDGFQAILENKLGTER